MKTFTEKQLVEFGNYLLSEERKQLYASHPQLGDSDLEERLSTVNHADVENFIVRQSKKELKPPTSNPVKPPHPDDWVRPVA